VPNYAYVAINIKGNEIKGEHVSPDESGVATMLQQQGYYATSIKKIRYDEYEHRWSPKAFR